MSRLLLKTTIGPVEDDWHVGRFSRLAAHLAALRAEDGQPLYRVTARDRTENAAGDDVDLAAFAAGGFDQLWLFAVDVTGALTETDAANIEAAQKAGRGVLLTRDHQDLGAFRGEKLRAGPADPRGAAGDDLHPIPQPIHARPLLALR